MSYLKILGCVAASIVGAATLWAGPAGSAQKSRLVLVREGRPEATIVLATRATQAAQIAAYELQYHLEKISGALVPIVTDDTEVKGPRILVGQSRYTEQLGLRGDDFKPQEYLIRIAPGTLILMGRDAPKYEQVDYGNLSTHWRFATNDLPEFFDEQATMYAVYDFLERYCQVRWYAPGEVGLVHPTWPTVMLPTGKEVRRAPAIKYRWVTQHYYPAALYPTSLDEFGPVLNSREQRLFWHRHRMGGESYDCNHSFYGYYRRFGKSHPEWFAQGRTFEYRMHLCLTNPEVIQQVAQDARDFFDGKGLQDGAFGLGDYFALCPVDDWRGWCQCERCRALLKDTEYTDDRLVSNYWFTFVNRVAREVAKTHPHKWLASLAYHYYSYPPDFAIEPNVSIQICLGARTLPDRGTQEGDQRKLAAWAAESRQRPKYVWLWYCYPYLWFQPFPGFFGNHIPSMIKRYRKAGVRGIFIEPSYTRQPGSFFLMDQVEFYMTWRLADDPGKNGPKMLREFFTLYYGEAAGGPMQKMYERMERIFATSKGYSFTDEFVYGQLATEANMAALEPLMRQAKAAGGTEMERKRVEIFEQALWQPMVAGRKAYLQKAQRATLVPKSAQVPRLTVAAGGDPSRVDWEGSVRLEGFMSLDGQTTDRSVSAAVTRDDAYLYLRLSESLDPAGLVVNGSVWDEDNWEIFLGPERKRPYYHLGVNSAGEYRALRQLTGSPEEGKPWDCAPKIVSQVSKAEGWTLMLPLPLFSGPGKPPEGGLAGPGSGIVYFNAIRSSGGGRRAVAWTPTFGGFHVPERMGELRLGS